jgi:hypothetical protein
LHDDLHSRYDLTDDVLPPLIGAGSLLLHTSGDAITIAILTGVRRSRPITAV